MKQIEKKVKNFFEPGDKLDTFFDEYEYRPEQQRMAEKIISVFLENKHLLVEAGTGTGKSLAYLVPALLTALENEEPVIISTNTINLQEQLIHKDIPLLQDIFDLDFNAVLVKGRRNYICTRRLIHHQRIAKLSSKEYEVLRKINEWIIDTPTGCRSDLNFKVDFKLWEQISSESDLCMRGNCPYYRQCHFTYARESAEEADLLVVNHHLLFADMALRKDKEMENQTAVLPYYKRIVFDEAHNLEEVATSYLGVRVNTGIMIKTLRYLYNNKDKVGLLLELRKVFSHLKNKEKRKLQQEIDSKLIPLVRKIIEKMSSLASQFISYINKMKEGESKLRLIEKVREDQFWQEVVLIEIDNLLVNLNSLKKALNKLLDKVAFYEEKIDDSDILVVELQAKIEFVSHISEVIQEIISTPVDDYVYWLEKRGDDCSLHSAPLDIAKEFQDNLLEKMDSVIFTSATLTVDDSFDFIKENLGLNDYPVDTLYVGSPFDYANQLQVGAIKGISQPFQDDFIKELVKGITEIVRLNQGRSLILFTSYGMLNSVYYKLKEKFESNSIKLYRQGSKSRKFLIEEFKENDRAVLLGTDSFWEGVDIPGQKLSCVIIVKFPFLVPSEPVIEAKIEDLKAKGENSFFKYVLPKAVIKFRQGIGRLIRTKTDKGWVVVFDNRIITKSYGRIFLKSFPKDSRIYIDKLNSLTKKIKNS